MKSLEAQLNELLKDAQIVANVCFQWGDTGKGKIMNLLASLWADVIVRSTGGANSGHTVHHQGKEIIHHLIPSGIEYDPEGKTCIIAKGTAIDPFALCEELDDLDSKSFSYNHLSISKDAHVVMPYHIQQDRSKNQSQKDGGIGSTGRGIGPCYTDRVARRGIVIQDLFNPAILAKKINAAKENYPAQNIDTDEIVQKLSALAERIRPFVTNTDQLLERLIREGKKIGLEGAQGTLLSIDHGTYPYVTSSDCSVNGMANGAGLSASAVDCILGMIKFPFMTRVGAGPFPTELGGFQAEEYSKQELKKIDELREYNIPFREENGKIVYDQQDPRIIELMNAEDNFIRGIGIRLAANEYGATTSRPRRVGWTDAVSARYAARINGPAKKTKLVIAKPDALAGIDEYRICASYFWPASTTEAEFDPSIDFLRGVAPSYRIYSGYGGFTGRMERKDLPPSVLQGLQDLELAVERPIGMISTGKGREDIIVCE